MELTIAKKELVKLIARVQGVAERKSTIPALSHALLVASKDVLHAFATDLYLSSQSTIGVTVKRDGMLAVPAKDLFERVRMMPDGDIRMTVDSSSLTLKSGARKFTLRGLPADEYPKVDRHPYDDVNITIEASTLSSLISKVASAVSTDESRPNLNAALLAWNGNEIRAVATDGHRLHTYSLPTPGRSASLSMLIPLRALLELHRFCDVDGDIRISRSGPTAWFTSGVNAFSTKLTEAQFPPYEQVIPKTHKSRATLSRTALIDAIRAVAVAADVKSQGVKLSFAADKLSLSSESSDRGDGRDELDIEYTGPAVTVGASAALVLDALNAVPDERLTVDLNGELDPIVIRSADEFIGIVMPQRI